MRLFLTAHADDGLVRELAGLLVDVKDGDEIVVENADLARRAQETWHAHNEPGRLTIVVDPEAVEAERARIRVENTKQVLEDRRAIGRMTGAERQSPHNSSFFGVPGAVPGTRTFGPPGKTEAPTE